MANYRLSNEAKNDLIRIYQYGISKFGVIQADAYFDALFVCFNTIAERPFSFESVAYIKPGYRRCVCGTDTIYFKQTEYCCYHDYCWQIRYRQHLVIKTTRTRA